LLRNSEGIEKRFKNYSKGDLKAILKRDSEGIEKRFKTI
jgi:hypothetical protein